MSVARKRAAIVGVALWATFIAARGAAPAPPPSPPPLDSIPFTIAGWAGETAPPLDAETAAGLSTDQYVRRFYSGPGGTVEMDIAYYGQPKVGANMHSPLNCLPGNGWQVTGSSERVLSTGIAPVNVRELTVARGTTKYAMTYWFQSRHRIVAGELAARLHLLGDAVRRQPADAGLVRVMMPFKGSGEPERQALAAFSSRLVPEIDVRLR
jgi:EpsI family protein